MLFVHVDSGFPAVMDTPHNQRCHCDVCARAVHGHTLVPTNTAARSHTATTRTAEILELHARAQSDSVRDAVREVLASERVDLRRLGLLCEVYGCPPADCVAVWTLLVSECARVRGMSDEHAEQGRSD